MKLSEYIKLLQEIKKKYGGELEVIYAIDDEGNAFHPVVYPPSCGKYFPKKHDYEAGEEPDAICVN